MKKKQKQQTVNFCIKQPEDLAPSQLKVEGRQRCVLRHNVCGILWSVMSATVFTVMHLFGGMCGHSGRAHACLCYSRVCMWMSMTHVRGTNVYRAFCGFIQNSDSSNVNDYILILYIV